MNIYMVAQIAENSNHITYRNLYNERKDGMDVIAVGGPMKVEKKNNSKKPGIAAVWMPLIINLLNQVCLRDKNEAQQGCPFSFVRCQIWKEWMKYWRILKLLSAVNFIVVSYQSRWRRETGRLLDIAVIKLPLQVVTVEIISQWCLPGSCSVFLSWTLTDSQFEVVNLFE